MVSTLLYTLQLLPLRFQWPSPIQEQALPPWNPDLPPAPYSSLLDHYPVPHEYLTNKTITAKLPPLDLRTSHTDLLFFLFYAGHCDSLQLTAASHLFSRGWRYNTKDRVWLARWPGITPTEKTLEWEEGLYQYFEPQVWRRIPAQYRLLYSELAEKEGAAAEEPANK